MDFQEKLKEYILSLGVSDVGFCEVGDFDNKNMKYAIFLMRLYPKLKMHRLIHIFIITEQSTHLLTALF